MSEEWQECRFAGKPVQHIPVIGVLANPDREHTRPCPDVHGHEVCPKACATCPVPEEKRKADLWDKCVPALVEALRKALPIVECAESRNDILLKCTVLNGATKEQTRLRNKHLRGKRREAWRARKAIEAALALLPEATPCQPE